MLDRNKAPPKNRRKTLIGKNILWHGKNQVVFSSAFPTRQCCCIFRNKLARAHCWTGQGCLWRVSHSSAWRCLNVRLTGPWNGWPPISTICLQCTTMMARGRRVKCVSWQWVGRGFTARPSSCSCSGYMAAPPPRPAAQKWPLTALPPASQMAYFQCFAATTCQHWHCLPLPSRQCPSFVLFSSSLRSRVIPQKSKNHLVSIAQTFRMHKYF